MVLCKKCKRREALENPPSFINSIRLLDSIPILCLNCWGKFKKIVSRIDMDKPHQTNDEKADDSYYMTALFWLRKYS